MFSNNFLLDNYNRNLEYFVLLGKNISYSLSDKVHGFIYKYFKLEDKYQYKVIDTDKINLLEENHLIDIIQSSSIRGGNLTTPYKKYLSSLDSLNKRYFFYPFILDNNKLDLDKSLYTYPIRSSNTFFKKNKNICFCSTDIAGLKRSLKDDRIDLDSMNNILILGSGGMAEAVIEYFVAYDRLIKKIDTDKNIYVFSRSDSIKKNIEDILCSKDLVGKDNLSSDLKSSKIYVNFYSLKDSFNGFIEDFRNKNKESRTNKNLLCINTLLLDVDIGFLYPGFKKIRSIFNDIYFMDLNYSFTSKVLSSNRSFFEGEGIRFKDGIDMLVYQAMYSECIWLDLDWNECLKIKDSTVNFLNSFR